MPASSQYEWNDISVSYLGRVLTGIQGIKYKVTSDDEFVYGRGRKPLSIQSGNESIEGEIKLLQSEFEALAESVRAINPLLKPSDIRADIIWTFERENVAITKIIQGAKFKEYEQSLEQGNKFMVITLPFMALDVKDA